MGIEDSVQRLVRGLTMAAVVTGTACTAPTEAKHTDQTDGTRSVLPSPTATVEGLPSALATATRVVEIPTAPPPTATKETTKEPVPPTPTQVVPTPTEVKSTPIPEKVLTQEEALAEVDRIIELVQNPDPELAKKYIEETDKQVYPPRPGAGKESLEADTYIIVYGPRDLKNPKPHQPISLSGVEEAIREGNNSLAQERIKELILSSNFSAPRRGVLGSVDVGKWTREQLKELDPGAKITGRDGRFPSSFDYSKLREEAIKALFNLYYELEPVTAGK